MDRRRLGGLAALLAVYTLYRLPLMVSPLSSWYHGMHQWTTIDVAIRTAHEGIVAGAYGFSNSGGNIHGMLGAPIVLLGADLRFIRLVMFVTGLICLYLVARIVRWYGGSRRTVVVTVLLLVLTPHFVIFTGFTLPEPVTITFGTASLLSYLYYRSGGESLIWAGASGAFAGLAAFNHFWGGMATITIVVYEGIVLAVVARQADGPSLANVLQRRIPLGVAHLVSLLPAAVLYLSYRAAGRTSSYGQYTIWESADQLLSPRWGKTMAAYLFEYQPATIVAGLLVLLLAWRIAGEGLTIQRDDVGNLPVVSPAAFWSVWLLAGGLIPVMFPLGSIIHEYYLWWTVVPSVGLVGWWASERAGTEQSWRRLLRTPRQLPLAAILILGLLVGSATLAGLQVSRSYIGPQGSGLYADGAPIICSYQRCVEPISDLHERQVGATIREVYDRDGEHVVAFYQKRANRPPRLLARIPESSVVYLQPSEDVPPHATVVVSATELSLPEADWRLHRRITAEDRTTYVYARR